MSNQPPSPPASRDSWARLSQHTHARIALGRTGGSLLSASLLDFRLSHARARDAVLAPFAPEKIAQKFIEHKIEIVPLRTAVTDRQTYLLRPDLGRQLDEASAHLLSENKALWSGRDLALIISNGLASQAAENHAVATVLPIFDYVTALGWTTTPVFIIPEARVKIQDQIGDLLHPRQSLMFLGERPGLGTPDSLSAYFTYQPKSSCTDADRNCVSNISQQGIPPTEAAYKITQLLVESVRRKVSGVPLKDTNLPELELATVKLANDQAASF